MDIGTLTGSIVIEDKLSSTMTIISDQVKKFADGFEGLTGTILVGSAAIVAAIGAVTASIIALGNRGAEVDDTAGTFERFTGSVQNAADTLKALQEGTRSTVDDFSLMQSANRLLAAEVKLSSDQFGTLSKAAFVLSDQGLGPVSSMLDMVSQAMLTGRTRSLEMKIGKIDLKKAEDDFAKSLGTTADKLSTAGQLEAKRIGILDALNDRVQKAGDIQKDFGDITSAAVAGIRNWGDELARSVANSPSVMKAVNDIGAALQEVFGGSGQKAIDAIVYGINKFAEAVSAAMPYVVDLAKAGVSIVKFFYDWRDVLEPIAAGLVTYGGLLVIVNGALFIGTGYMKLYAYGMALISGEATIAIPALTGVAGAITKISLAVGALYAGYQLGTWLEQNTKWGRELSDSFEYAALRVQGFSAAEADAMIATDHATEAAKRSAAQNKETSGTTLELGRVMGNLGADIVDTSKFLNTATEAAAALKTRLDDLSGKSTIAKAKELASDYEKLNLALKGGVSALSPDKQLAMNKAMTAAIDVQERMGKAVDHTFVLLKLATSAISEQLPYVGQLAKGWKDVTYEMLKVQEPLKLLGQNPMMFNELLRDGIPKPFIDESGVTIANALTGPSLKAQIGANLQQLPQLLVSSLTGGGGVSGAASAMGSMLGSTIGKSIGAGIKMLGKFGGPIGEALGALAGPLMEKFFSMFGNATKSAIEKAFGSYDTLRTQLNTLTGDAKTAGDALWVSLTQKTGKNDTSTAAKLIQQINDLLDQEKTKATEAASTLVSEHQTALDEINKRYDEMFSAIDSEYKSLTASVANEAEETVMGVVETQQRARMAQLEADKLALEKKKQDEIFAADETYGAWLEAGKTVDAQLRDIFEREYVIPIRWERSDSGQPEYHASGGIVGSPRGTDTVPAWLTPGEEVLTVNESRARHSQQPITIPIVLRTGNEVIAKHVVKTFVNGGI